MDASSLPKGWVVRESKSRVGRSYFFNTSTGQSSWKHPSLISNKSDNKSPKKKEKRRHDDSCSVISEDTIQSKHVLLSPVSPTASFVSITNQSKKSSIVTPIEFNTPVKEDSERIQKSDYMSSRQSPNEVSPTEHQFQCSRARANNIAQWVSSVNSNCESSEHRSVKESSLGTEWKQDVYTKKIKKKKKKKRNMPIMHESSSAETDKSKQPKLTQNNSESCNMTPPTAPATSKLLEMKSDDTKTLRPPLKKVNQRNKSANKAPHSPIKPMTSPSFTSNLFTPFSQFSYQQERRNEPYATPMNIDRNNQRFSTPFMKSPPSVGQQDLSSSPIIMNLPTTETPNLFTNTIKQQEFENLEKTDTSSDINEQRDSGFDEVLDMDIDNFEEMTQLIKAELQEVRSDFQLDIQKAKERCLGECSIYEDGVHIILDTNVLLSHLKMVNELKDLPIEGVSRPVLVIPWIVMQELDSLKSDSRRPRQNNEDGVGVDTLARKAIRFLHSCFESKHPRIRGQTIDEASEQLNTIFEETNDDRILHCCLVVKRQVGNGKAVLFSNDQSLCNKAMINGVKAFNHENLLNGLKELVQTVHSVVLQAGNFTEYYEQLAVQERLAKIRTKADDILCELKCIIREGLSVAVESEMRAAYEDLWEKIVCLKPPWTVVDLLQILNKHWIAVFGDVVGRKHQSTLKELMKLLHPEKGVPGCIANVTTILQHARHLFDAFSLRSSYSGTMTKCLAAIEVLQQKCKECKNEHLPRLILPGSGQPDLIAGALPYTDPCTSMATNIEEVTPPGSDETASVSSSSVQGEINSVASRQPHSEILSTFEVIWSAVTQFSAQIFNALSYPNPIPASVIENLPKPTRNEAISFLGLLCRCLSALVTALQNVLRIPVEGLSEDQQSLEKLVFTIKSFTKEIIGQNSQMSVDALFFFCHDSNTRSALIQGVSQLDRALAMLQHCASCIV